MDNRVVLVTHTDMDGVACAVLGHAAFLGKLEVYYEGYDTVDQRLREIMNSFLGCSGTIYITDISPRDHDVVANLDELNGEPLHSVVLLDHHKSAEERLGEYNWAEFDMNICGAMLFYQFLMGGEHWIRVRRFGEFIKLVNDYDTWQHKYQESKQLNYLLAAVGREMFLERCLTRPAEYINDVDELFIKVYMDKLDKYCKRSLELTKECKDKAGHRVGVLFCDNYRASEVGHYILDRAEYDYVAMIDMRQMTVSLRSRKVDVGSVASKKGGGGHRYSAGYPIKPENWGMRI